MRAGSKIVVAIGISAIAACAEPKQPKTGTIHDVFIDGKSDQPIGVIERACGRVLDKR